MGLTVPPDVRLSKSACGFYGKQVVLNLAFFHPLFSRLTNHLMKGFSSGTTNRSILCELHLHPCLQLNEAMTPISHYIKQTLVVPLVSIDVYVFTVAVIVQEYLGARPSKSLYLYLLHLHFQFIQGTFYFRRSELSRFPQSTQICMSQHKKHFSAVQRTQMKQLQLHQQPKT